MTEAPRNEFTTYAIVQGLWLGPSAHDLSSPGMTEALEAFGDRLKWRACRRLFDYWCERAATDGGIPLYDRRWHIDLADIAKQLYSRERLPGTTDIRYRYVGVVIAERFGADFTGWPATAFSRRSPEEVWIHNQRLFEGGHLALFDFAYGHIDKPYVKGVSIEVPLRGPGGDIQFVIGAAHYFD